MLLLNCGRHLTCYKSGHFKDATINISPWFSCKITFTSTSPWKLNVLKSYRKHVYCFHVVIFRLRFKATSFFFFFNPRMCYRNLWNLITFTVTKKDLWTFAFRQKCLFHCLYYSFFSTPMALNFSAAQSYHCWAEPRNSTPKTQTTSWRKRRRQRYMSRYFGHPLCH